MPEQNNRQHARAIMEVLMTDIELDRNSPEACYSDGIRTMRDFLSTSGSGGVKMDVLERMLRDKPGDSMMYPPEVQKILTSIDTKLQFNMRYFSYLAAQQMNLTDRPCDISRTGMSFPSSFCVEPGEVMMIRSLLPLDPPLISSFILEVSWCRSTPDRTSLPYRIGGSFRFRNDYEKTVISRLVSHYMT